ncbi:MAG TPA: ATP-binding protein [Vicinamibacterales bacterium]|nr:ATP-binding protein [Vicinamibacterales bacterium]
MSLGPRRDWWRLAAALAAIASVTAVLRWLAVSNAGTVSTSYLMVVLVVAATSRLLVAIVTSIAAMLCLNFFFLPPIGNLTIAEPHNWVALFAFLAVSLVASHLSAVAHARTEEAVGRRDELARLFDLSRDVLMMTDSPEALAVLARSVARRFDLDFVAVALPHKDDWNVFEAGTGHLDLDRRELSKALASAQAYLEFDAHARTYAGHRTMTVEGRDIRLVPLRVGTKPIGILAAAGRPVEAGTLDALAGVVAIAIERAQFLEERKASELTRQSEQLKTALLASLGHDLRTPLTAIRVAASNIVAPGLTPGDRAGQSELILTEVERLTRLFENTLEMARIDAGAVATESRWTHPSEIVAAARDQVEHTLAGNRVRVSIDKDQPVRLDPRLTASALAHLLENAAQYTPVESPIDVDVRMSDEGLRLAVRDHGPGIAPADLPHVFERFYRGSAAKARASGTGMGLWIVRGLLAVEQGRVWAENCPGGGALFTIVVPAAMKEVS